MVVYLQMEVAMRHVEFAKILEVTPNYWRMVRRKERSLSFKKARTAAVMLRTTIDLWMDNPEVTADQREKAWEKFANGN